LLALSGRQSFAANQGGMLSLEYINMCTISRHPSLPAAGGQPERAEQLFERLCRVCKPDASTFNCLVRVYCRLGKVREAANMLEIMLRSGQHVDPATSDAAIDTCWATGIVPLQQVAVQMYKRAQQQGSHQTHMAKQVRAVLMSASSKQCLWVLGRHTGPRCTRSFTAI
jgi:pentatricopeptide repeat protein